MGLITPFDPWKDGFCTCPEKYSLNPYTGCSHRCVYCYITSYIPKGFDCRPKKDLLKRVRSELKGLKRPLISMSNSSDPYPPMEKKMGITRGVLRLLQDRGFPAQIVTKSDIVVRDADILKEMPSSVMVTITTLTPQSRRLEPFAPPPAKRLEAVRSLVEEGIPMGVRIDPVIPVLSSDLEELIEAVAAAGASHVTSSTLKFKPDSWKRFKEAFPTAAEEIYPLYFEEGERHAGARYLSAGLRCEMLGSVKSLVEKKGMTFAVCRESLDLNSGKTCDGTHLIRYLDENQK